MSVREPTPIREAVAPPRPPEGWLPEEPQSQRSQWHHFCLGDLPICGGYYLGPADPDHHGSHKDTPKEGKCPACVWSLQRERRDWWTSLPGAQRRGLSPYDRFQEGQLE